MPAKTKQGTTKEARGEHYGERLQPWDLQKHMETSGDAFVDARRADALKYAFRIKGDKDKLIDDLEKAKHCLDAAISQLKDPDFFPNT